jgi:spermidine/putrescine-binding protein
MNRRSLLAAVGTGAALGLAGCTGGGGSNEGSGQNAAGSDGTTVGTTGSGGGAKDFGGQEITVMLNGGPIQEGFRKFVIPRVEEKYNLNINSKVGFTSTQVSQIQANPNNPPDVLNMDVIGVARAYRNGWLEPMTNYTDSVLTNWDQIYSKVRFDQYDNTGAAWMIGEVCPVVNTSTGTWDSPPSSWEAVFTDSEDVALTPFSWTNGVYTLLVASALETGNGAEYFQSSDVDVDAGFKYLEENLAPKEPTVVTGGSQFRQQMASGQIDTINNYFTFGLTDVVLQNDPVQLARRPDPFGIPIAETLAVTKNSDNKEAAMAYVNEAFSKEMQEKLSQFMGSGVTTKNAELQQKAKDFGAPTPDTWDKLVWPDFEFIGQNRSDWSQRYAQLFGSG